MISRKIIIYLLLLIVLLLVPSVAGADDLGGRGATVTLDLTPTNPPVNPPAGNEVTSRFIVTADDAVKNLGYTVNGVSNCGELSISGAEVTTITILTNPPQNSNEKIVLINSGISHDFENNQFVITINPHRHSVIIRVHLSLVDVPVTPNPNPNPNPGEDDDDDEDDSGTEPKPENPSYPVNPPVNPVVPVIPEVPDTPVTPDVPVNPDTPGSDIPGSDEPYRPILPPADNVYNLAGFIPLLAGFLLLLLLFFLRGNLVYRILVKNAKKHGEKPDKEEKEHLKQIASAIVSRIRDEEKYPEWRKNTDLMKRLWFDIESVLDEMNYVRAVPRGALVAEIIKAARGKINRHRL